MEILIVAIPISALKKNQFSFMETLDFSRAASLSRNVLRDLHYYRHPAAAGLLEMTIFEGLKAKI
jgi:hypothetical protein